MSLTSKIQQILSPILYHSENDTGLNDFPNYATLEAWFLLHTELRLPVGNECANYSRDSQKLAENDGYLLSTCLVYDGVAYNTQVQPKGTYHIANSAIVIDSNSVYYVDLAFNQLLKLCDLGGKYYEPTNQQPNLKPSN